MQLIKISGSQFLQLRFIYNCVSAELGMNGLHIIFHFVGCGFNNRTPNLDGKAFFLLDL